MLCENRGNGVGTVGALRFSYYYLENFHLLMCASMGLPAGVVFDRSWE